MAISIDSVSVGTDSATVGFSYVPDAGAPATADSSFFYFGPSNAYDPSQPNDGYPSACRVAGSGPYTATFSPGVGAGQPFHFVAGVFIGAATNDSGDQSATMPNGGTQDSSATVSAVTATGANIAWGSSDPGMGSVSYWKTGDTTQLSEAETVATVTHSVALTELLGGTAYTYQFTTTFVNEALPPAVSAQASFSTPADSGPPDPPGRLGVGVSPQRIAVGQAATITAQVLARNGSPVAGVPIHFAMGLAGGLQGSLSVTAGATDAAGRCTSAFTSTGVQGGRLAFRVVQVIAGSAPHLKVRRALVFAQPTGRPGQDGGEGRGRG
jgi:hypothetical protein